MNTLRFLVAAIVLAGCGESGPLAPDLDVHGNYTLNELSFDPQGSLPNVDLRARTTTSIPRLVVATDRRAQLIFEDPSSGLVTTANATYSITQDGGVRFDFGDNSSLRRGTFLSRRMTFTYDEAVHSLTFAGTSPDGVDRQRLLALVPEWATEQLFDPVPGMLRVVYKLGTVE